MAMAARRLDLLEKLSIDMGPGLATAHRLDVTDPAQVDAVIREADTVMGGLDVVVVNAGRGGGARIGTGHDGENRDVLATNLTGALAQCETALSVFRARGGGHLVLVSSVAARRGLPASGAVYSASKAALSTLGEALHLELKGEGITVTTLSPGYVRTDLSARSRFPLMTGVERAVETMIAAMDAEKTAVTVPPWPWAPLAWVLRHAPASLIRRSM